MDLEHEQRLSKVEARSESNTHRLNRLEGVVEAIHDLASNMKSMADKQNQTSDDVKELKGKVIELEQKPAKRWDGMIDKSIGALIGGLIAFALFQLGLG